jgi:hypothetical protein
MNYTTLLPRHIYPPTNYLEKQQDAKLANDYHYNMPFTGLVMQKNKKCPACYRFYSSQKRPNYGLH